MSLYYYHPANQKLNDMQGIREEYPTASIPDGGDVTVFGYFPIMESQVPEYDRLTQTLVWVIKSEGSSRGQVFKREYSIAHLPNAEVQENLKLHLQNKKEHFSAILERNLDDFAKQRGYKDIATAIGYASSAVKGFKADALICSALRDKSWVALYEVFDKIDSKQIPLPELFSEIEKFLPELKWS